MYCQLDFQGGAGSAADTEATIAANGPRVYEPARRAQAVAPLILRNRRDRRAGCRRPSTRRVRRVNPLLDDGARKRWVGVPGRHAQGCFYDIENICFTRKSACLQIENSLYLLYP